MRVRFPQRLFRAALQLPEGNWRPGVVVVHPRIRWRHSALLAIQRAAEQHLVRTLQTAFETAKREGRHTLLHRDLEALVVDQKTG